MLTPLDYAVIVIYVIGVAAFGIKAGGRQRTTTGARDMLGTLPGTGRAALAFGNR